MCGVILHGGGLSLPSSFRTESSFPAFQVRATVAPILSAHATLQGMYIKTEREVAPTQLKGALYIQ
jgi:hypothetical protein